MTQTTRTVLIIDDSPEDRELYRRYLKRDREYSYTFLEAGLGKQGLELWQQQPDAVLLDYRLPDIDGVEFLRQLQPSSPQLRFPVIMVTGQGNEETAVEAMKAGAQDYLVKEQITPQRLQQAVNATIATVQLHSQIQLRIKREQLISEITRKIYQKTDLPEILQTIVTQTRLFLKVDRVFMYRFQPDFSGVITVESVGSDWLPILNIQVNDQYFMETRGEDYRLGRIQVVADIDTAGLTQCHVDLLVKFQIRANLVVAIVHQETLWGLLVANQCCAPRQWQPFEIDLLQELTSLVGIALQQSALYQATQSLQESLQREKAIAAVIQRMRQTLDMETIFQATTAELRQFMKCDRVVVYQFNADWSGQFVAESAGEGWTPLMQPESNNFDGTQLVNESHCNVITTMLRGTPEPVADSYLQETKGGIYNQGINCRVTEDIYQAGFTPCYIDLLEQLEIRAYMIVPIFCGSQLWGLLAIYQNLEPRAWSEAEINTVVQIAIQLGVALQQAQLLQETKQQAMQLQEAAYAAQAANRAKSKFLANMSHELRTPLNGIMGYAQILQRDSNTTVKQQENIQIIYNCSQHLLTLINDILSLSKIEANKIEIYPETFEFKPFLQDSTAIFSLKAKQKFIEFSYEAMTQLPKIVCADEKRLRQILINLISNAIKFTDRGSVSLKVGVIASTEKDVKNVKNQQESPSNHPSYPRLHTSHKIRFIIEDTGCGISPEELEKIFLPFEQVGNISRQTEGTGLGLTITQKLLFLMGSEIFVESTPGVGSKFWFDLDLPVSSDITELILKPTNTVLGYEGKKQKIMVVDDRSENRSVLVNFLKPLGFELGEAADGQAALEIALEFKPDLILSDLVMPRMDGFVMIQKLRQLPLFQSIAIIAVSASVFNEDRQKCLELGYNDFLAKPIQLPELLEKIKSNLNLSWIYEPEFSGENVREAVATTPVSMTVPPREELLVLYQAAKSCYVEDVDREINRMQQLEPEYSSFVAMVVQLSNDFEYEAIVKLVDRYYHGE